MAEFKFTNKAVEDLSKIWEYTFKNWSENQADTYYEMLISHCQEIANDPNVGKNYDGITQNLLGLKTNRHIIFYRILDEGFIEITRILHERMNLKSRLTE